MEKDSLFQFNNLKKQRNLICAVSTVEFGNISFQYQEKDKVLKNRRKIAEKLGINLKNIYEMDQVHGNNVRVLDSKSFRALDNNIIPKTDGLITNQKNVFLMIQTADCYPVVFFDPDKKVVSAVHVGWRGAIEKIFLTALIKMTGRFACQPEDILVGVGPGIGSCCFKHKNLIQNKLPEWQEFIKKEKNGRQSVDIKSFIRTRLVEGGVKKANIETIDICTNCSQKFFSHFCSLQAGEREGRFATIIGLKC